MEGEAGQTTINGGCIPSACARELIFITENKLGRFQAYKSNPTSVIASFAPAKA